MTDDQEIRSLLARYERSLNDGDADSAAASFTADGIFMPTTLPTISGSGMRQGYAAIFANIKLSVSFTIDELVVVDASFAYALTRSQGTQTVLATGDESVESNREIFIFAREDAGWKISRYLFNKPT